MVPDKIIIHQPTMALTTDSRRSVRSILPSVIKDQYDYLAKIIIVGSSGTGKSSILHRFVKDDFNQSVLSSQTIGVEFSSKVIEVEDYKVKLQLWDTAGQERFRSLTRSYYRGSAGVVLCYDMTRSQTLLELEEFVQDVRALCDGSSLVLVGNKCDLDENIEVNEVDVAKFIKKNGIEYHLQSSAKNGYNVLEIFNTITTSILHKIETGEIDPEVQSFGVQYGDLIPNNWDQTVNSSKFNTMDQSPRNIIRRKKTTLSLIDRTLDTKTKNTCSC